MKRTVLVLLVALGAAGLVAWLVRAKSAPPQVSFAKTERASISSVVSTNGKVEPIEYAEVRVEAAGLVKRVAVHAGETVAKDAVLAELGTPGVEEEIEAASAREAQARAELSTLEAGGPSADEAEIAGSLQRLRSDREAAQKNLESLDRLTKKQAATPFEAEQARQAVRSLDVQIVSLEHRRTALVGKGDLAAAQARVREAAANVQSTKSRVIRSLIHAPMAGTIYDLPARTGSYLNVGDTVARIGKLDPVRVRVYVDEPELGRIAAGQKVRLTWDGLAGREWNGVVASRPSQVIALGSRQVGEVLCTIDNPGRELAPGTNVNAFILTQVVENALTIPKAAVRRGNGVGVFVLQGDSTVKWQPVTTGISDALRVEIRSGLQAGDAVSLAADVALNSGDSVTPNFK